MENESCSVYDVPCWLGWLMTEIKAMFLWIWLQILNAVAAFIEWIPVPDFLQNIDGFQLPDNIIFFTTLFQIPAGLAIMVSAYTIRFFLRRIPIVG